MKTPEKVDSETLEMMILEGVNDADMTTLAKMAEIMLGVPITFKEDGGPGDVIEDVIIHWDKTITIDT